MAGISESCSVCGTTFEVQFRYQMEEQGSGFAFFCSQRCLEKNQAGGEAATCDACAKRFAPELVSQVLYVGGKRRYACSLQCRGQVIDEENGARLGEIEQAPRILEERTEVRATPVHPSAQPVSITPAPAQKKAPAQPAAGTPTRIAVFNHKGGTGKTTTAVSIAAGLAARGKRVLLVDTDAQGNVAVSLGANSEESLYHVLVMGLRVADAVTEVRPNLFLLPANETLAAAELYLAGRQNRNRVLDGRLAAAAKDYDHVVIDCSPSLSLMNQNALVFADSVLVPVACDYLSLVGVRQVIKTVKSVNALLHHPVQIWGVLPTFYDGRANICRDAVSTLKSHFGDRCLSPVRAAMKIKEAPAEAQTIFEYAAGSNAADDYAAVVERILTGRAAAAATTTRATA